MIQFGVEEGLLGNKRFIPGEHRLESIFLRVDCESTVNNNNGEHNVSCSMIVFEHQWDKIFQFTKKNKDEWNDVRRMFQTLLVAPTGEKNHIKQVNSQ